jgi:hypothetical protein
MNPSPRPRDSQPERVRDAERSLPAEPMGDPLPLAYRVLGSHWFRRFRVLDGDVLTRTGRGENCQASVLPGGSVALPSRSVMGNRGNRIGLMHALAHLISPEDEEWHSPDFCRLELEMVGQWVSPEARDQLRQAFKTFHVRVHTLTPEARAAVRKRWHDRQTVAIRGDLEAMLKKYE